MTALRERFGLAALGAAALAFWLAVTLFWYLGYAQKLFEGQGRSVTAELTNAQQLQEGDPVRVDGREEGRVRDIEPVDGGRVARVRFDVADDAGPLYADSTVQLRWKTLLGSAFYLEVDRGTPQAGDLAGRTIPARQTFTQVEVDDVTAVFDGDARKGLTTIPGELSRALRDRGDVPALLDAAADASPSLEAGLNAARGQTPDTDLRRVISGTAAAMTALDAPRDDLRRLVAGAGATLATTGARDRELRQVLDAGPQVTERVRSTLARLDGTLGKADGLVAKLDGPADDIAPTLRELRPTLLRTRSLLDRAEPLVRTLRPTVASLAGLARRGVPLLDGLQPSFDRLDGKILPYLARKDPGTGKPTSVMIGGTAAGFGGSAGQRDTNGHFIRFPASLGTSSPTVYLPCKTALTDPTAGQVAACDSLEQAAQSYFSYLPKLTPATRGRGK